MVDRLRWAPDRADRLVEAVRSAWLAGRGRALVLLGDAPDPIAVADHPWCPVHDLSLPPPTQARLLPGDPSAGCPTCRGVGCEQCGGSGLGPLLRGQRLAGRTLPGLRKSPVAELTDWLDAVAPEPRSAPLIRECRSRLERLLRLGLGALPLARPARDLALGEWSRLRLAGRLTDETRGALVLVDEPGWGLDPEGASRVAAECRRLVAQGNSVLVVEHRPEILRAADLVVELGPGAGQLGGAVVFVGSVEALSRSSSATGQALRGEISLPTLAPPPIAGRPLRIDGVRGACLDGAALDLPFEGLVALVGPGGSGRRSLLLGALGPAIALRLGLAGPTPYPHASLTGAEQVERLVLVDPRPFGRSGRSNVVTALGAWTPIRGLLAATREAKILGIGPGHFSFNRPGGRCEACEGTGVVELGPSLALGVEQPCEVCLGRRFDPATLAVRWRGASVADLLEMRVEAARELLANQRRVGPLLDALARVGLGYLPLGQRTDTLSGGENQRLRLAAELAQARPVLGQPLPLRGSLILVDRPELGLHDADLGPVLAVFDRLIGAGAVVVVVTDHPLLAAAAHHRARVRP